MIIMANDFVPVNINSNNGNPRISNIENALYLTPLSLVERIINTPNTKRQAKQIQRQIPTQAPYSPRTFQITEEKKNDFRHLSAPVHTEENWNLLEN